MVTIALLASAMIVFTVQFAGIAFSFVYFRLNIDLCPETRKPAAW